jgi:hypothetical protein
MLTQRKRFYVRPQKNALCLKTDKGKIGNKKMVSGKIPKTILRTPSGIRTLDPLIKSQLLYQLS